MLEHKHQKYYSNFRKVSFDAVLKSMRVIRKYILWMVQCAHRISFLAIAYAANHFMLIDALFKLLIWLRYVFLWKLRLQNSLQ